MADGSIRIDTKLDNSGIPKDLAELKKLVEEGGDNVSDELVYQVAELENKWKAVLTKQKENNASVEEYRKQLEQALAIESKLSNAREGLKVDIDNEGLAEQDYKTTLSSQSQSQLINARNMVKETQATVQSLEQQLATLGNSMTLDQKLMNAQQKGYGLDAQMEQLNVKSTVLANNFRLDNKLEEAIVKSIQLNSSISSASAPTEGLKGRMGKVVSLLAKGASTATKLGSGLRQSAKHSNGLASSLKNGLSSLAKKAGMLVGIRSAYRVISQLGSTWLSNGTAIANQTQATLTATKNSLANAVGPLVQWITNLLATAVQYLGGLIKALGGVDIFASSAKGASDSLASGAKSAKEIHKQLAGFDEMNILSSENDSSSGGGSAGTVTADVELTGLGDWSKIIDMFKEAWKNGDFTEIGELVGNKVNNALRSINWGPIQETSRKIASSIATFLNGYIASVDWNLVGTTVGQGLNTAIYFAETFVTKFDWKGFGKAIGNYLNGALNSIDWASLGNTISTLCKGVLDTLIEAVTTFDWIGLGAKVYEFISNIDWAGIGAKIIVAIALGFVGLGSAIISLIGEALNDVHAYFYERVEEMGGNVILGLLKGILDGLVGIAKWLYDNLVQPIIDGVKKMFGINSPSTVFAEIGGYLIEGMTEGIRKFFEDPLGALKELYEKIKGVFSTVKEWFKEKFDGAVENIKEAFKLENIKRFFEEVWTGIKNIFAKIPEWFKTKFTEAWTNVKNVFSSGGKIFDGIKDGIADLFKNIVNKLISGINTIIAWPFDKINGMLNTIRNVTIPIINQKPFAGLWGQNPIDVPNIPKLATGTIATQPMFAQIAEYSGAKTNPEIVSPVSMMYDTMVRALKETGYNSNNGTQTIILQVDGKVLAKIVNDQNKKLNFVGVG